jgi:predicted DNA binding CopG/RHH family protein
MKLSKEEIEILDAFESGKLKSIPNAKNEIQNHRKYARNTLIKNKRINIRISERDLVHLQREAVKEGIPYQTLISSILHKYAANH